MIRDAFPASGIGSSRRIWHKGSDLASADPLILDGSGNYHDVTGTTGISEIRVPAGTLFMFQFDGALTLTHSATLDLPGEANFTTSAGDRLIGFAEADNSVQVLSLTRASGKAVAAVTLGTEQASTSGTSIDFTGIPAGTKRITIMFVGVSTSGVDHYLLQIGDAGGVEATGYVGIGSEITGGTVGTNASTAGFMIVRGPAAGDTFHGHVTIVLEDSTNFSWTESGVLGEDNSGTNISGGSKSLSAELDRIRITTAGGSDTFDAGAINVSYE